MWGAGLGAEVSWVKRSALNKKSRCSPEIASLMNRLSRLHLSIKLKTVSETGLSLSVHEELLANYSLRFRPMLLFRRYLFIAAQSVQA